jgi:1-acyl-sn-glycerol-3-phosphate acyltransferase
MRGLFNGGVVVVSTIILGSAAIVLTLIPRVGERCFFFCEKLWSGTITVLCGIRVEGELRDAGDVDWKRAYVYMSNHQSHYDIPCIVRALPADLRFLTKKELAAIPVFGWALKVAGFVFIDRKNRERALKSVKKAADDLAEKGRSIVVFPEGTRSNDGTMGEFKKGGFHLAMQARAVIVPLGVSGTRSVLPKGALFIRPGRVKVRAGRPIDASAYTPDELPKLMTDVRGAVQALIEKE